MAVNPDNSIYVPQPSAYGRIIREKGTLRLVVIAILLAVAWYIYDSVHTSMMNQVKWPTLQPSSAGLVVIGLRDKDRPGWQHRYEARESNRSWQIRYNEDYAGQSHAADEDDSPESKDRGSNNPGATHKGNAGAVVTNEELLKECPVVLNGSHFTGASVEEKFDNFLEKNYYAVHLDLNDEARSRYWQFSNAHEGERLAFILNNEVLTCPRMDNMYVSSLTIEPVWIKADAQKLVDFINGQAKK